MTFVEKQSIGTAVFPLNVVLDTTRSIERRAVSPVDDLS